MILSPQTIPLLAIAAGLTLWAGCGGRGTIPCGGQVTLDGRPLEGAAVMFATVDGRATATGRTDAQGRFRLTTFKPFDGALPGEYRVTVAAFAAVGTTGQGGGGSDEFETGEDPEPSAKTAKGGAPIRRLTPQRYSQPQSSGLTATVSSSDREFSFALTSK